MSWHTVWATASIWLTTKSWCLKFLAVIGYDCLFASFCYFTVLHLYFYRIVNCFSQSTYVILPHHHCFHGLHMYVWSPNISFLMSTYVFFIPSKIYDSVFTSSSLLSEASEIWILLSAMEQMTKPRTMQTAATKIFILLTKNILDIILYCILFLSKISWFGDVY